MEALRQALDAEVDEPVEWLDRESGANADLKDSVLKMPVMT
jgi:hypothetical protein